MRVWITLTAIGIPAAAAVAAGMAPPAAPDFNREVRPLLSRHCFKCHGPDEGQRQAKLRLDVRTAALAPALTGRRAIVPGKPEESELVRRIYAAEPGRLMPPVHAKIPLSEAEKSVLRRWVAAGAKYDQHWAFVPPHAAPPPKVKNAAWVRNPIDNFVLARLEAAGLKPAPEADPYTLVRRLYLDLIGIPPTPEEADAFVREIEAEQALGPPRSGGKRSGVKALGTGASSPTPQRPNASTPTAYERLVDRLLASPQYGERWARRWLDLARYADTNGYEKDRARSIWPYRDWVINALNADMPFNQFTVEQLAGDLLPNATQDQKIATGFHRNTMLNEEGGIDPLEFRFHAMTDRVATTATTWLGLTVGCAQCHTHKFDPIPHREYYQFMAFLDNTEEPELEVARPELAAKRAEVEAQISAREKDLANRFPPEGEFTWQAVEPRVSTVSGAKVELLPDRSARLSGTNPQTDLYTVSFETDLVGVDALRLEALTDPSLGGNGPGRTPHGNFVLSDISVLVAPVGSAILGESVKLSRAEADFSQDGFPASAAIDGQAGTGWAIHGPGKWNVDRTLTVHFEKPPVHLGKTRWIVYLRQQHGMQHTLGRFRLSLGRRQGEEGKPLEVRRREHLEKKFNAWLASQSARAVHWTVLKPTAAKSNLPLLTVEPDGTVFASGDQSKRDVYDVSLSTPLQNITALRLEALPDDRLPKHGPGRIFYEGPFGDFFLSEVSLKAGETPVKLARASQSFPPGANQATLDGNPQTGWSINGGQGKAHSIVFNLAAPLADARNLNLQLLFERYFAAGLGRFRVSVTTDARAAEAGLPADLEALLLLPAERRTPAQRDQLMAAFLAQAPELAAEREEIQKLRTQIPAFPTTLVMQERPAENPRRTFIRKRGEFLQPTEQVTPGTLTALHPLPPGVPRNRLTFARWLVDPKNPLVGRVTVNRQWAAFFGRGLVRTTEDFGYQGESPTHPELLDWLAARFVGVESPESQVPSRTSRDSGIGTRDSGLTPWSLKSLHRLIVTSATYRQSAANPQSTLRNPKSVDPENRLLSRAPRFRVEGELVRDMALQVSGLLSRKIGGPSVFPPQPPGVTSEGTYGALQWKVSEGEDRYRRGLYTFSKRTAPYAMFTTFDAPSGEACVARREVSNTPLQALTLLNDTVFVEAAQALGRMLAARPGTVEERVTYLFRRVLTRPPHADEVALLVRYYQAQKARFEKKELDPAPLAGPGDGDPAERAAWTALARSLLNLDEMVTRE